VNPSTEFRLPVEVALGGALMREAATLAVIVRFVGHLPLNRINNDSFGARRSGADRKASHNQRNRKSPANRD
jgi:hypothetical protein